MTKPQLKAITCDVTEADIVKRGWQLILISFGFVVTFSVAASQQITVSPKGEIARSVERIAEILQKSFDKQDDQGCDRGHDDRGSDLCAQWKAADAAEESAKWTERTFWQGCVGAIFGLFTLIAAIFAASYAKRAAIATEATIIESRRIGEAQVRAYLNVTKALLYSSGKPGEQILLAELFVKNTGQSPAHSVKWNLDLSIKNSRDETILHRSNKPVPFEQSIGAGLELPLYRWGQDMNFEEARHFIAPDLLADFKGSVEAIDVFDRKICEEFRFVGPMKIEEQYIKFELERVPQFIRQNKDRSTT